MEGKITSSSKIALPGVPLEPYGLSDLPPLVLDSLVLLGSRFRDKGVRLILFGSFVKGTARPRSDLDIAVIFDQPQVRPRRRLELHNALEELPTVRSVDLVELDGTASELTAEVLRNGFPLHELGNIVHAQVGRL